MAMKTGVIISLNENVREKMLQLRDLGIPTCQLCCWDDSKYTPEYEQLVRDALRESGVEISAFWAGYSGPAIWNFYQGPATLGIVPPAYRMRRTEQLIAGADFAARLGVTDVATHVGFIPENPNDPDYMGTVSAIQYIMRFLKPRGQYFLFETGQETPVTILRIIGDIGTGNLGVNLDPANLLLYGKANPVDALDIIGPYVRGVHAKDGEYPTDGHFLGKEKALGEGRVNYPAFIAKLKALGYDGALTIEREIHGPQQLEDILKAKALLESLM